MVKMRKPSGSSSRVEKPARGSRFLPVARRPSPLALVMDSRTAAHVLSEIAALLELRAENRFKSRAYRGAAKAVLALDTDDLTPLLRSGELARVRGIGRATLAVVTD